MERKFFLGSDGSTYQLSVGRIRDSTSLLSVLSFQRLRTVGAEVLVVTCQHISLGENLTWKWFWSTSLCEEKTGTVTDLGRGFSELDIGICSEKAGRNIRVFDWKRWSGSWKHLHLLNFSKCSPRVSHFPDVKLTFKKRKTVSKFQTLVNDKYAEIFRGKCTYECNLFWNAPKNEMDWWTDVIDEQMDWRTDVYLNVTCRTWWWVYGVH